MQGFGGAWIGDAAIAGAFWFPGTVIGTAFWNIREENAHKLNNASFDDVVEHAENRACDLGPNPVSRGIRALFRAFRSDHRSEPTELAWILWLVVAALLLIWYVRHRTLVIGVLAAVSLLVFVATFLVILQVSRKAVFVGAGWSTEWALGFVVWIIGITDCVFLLAPPFHSDYFDILRASVAGVTTNDQGEGLNAALFVIYQIFGAILFLMTAIAFIASATAVICAIFLFAKVWAAPLWLRVYASTRWASSTGFLWFAVIIGIVSLGFSSGLVFTFITKG